MQCLLKTVIDQIKKIPCFFNGNDLIRMKSLMMKFFVLCIMYLMYVYYVWIMCVLCIVNIIY